MSRDSRTTAPAATRTHRGRRIALLVTIVALVALVALVAGAGGFEMEQWRAEAACGREDVAPEGASSWSLGWSWAPPGFTCTYGDGTTLRSLWW